MFNRYYVDRRSYSSNTSCGLSHVTVTEKKAPTDESVKLLNEMQEKAKENLIAHIICKDNSFNFDLIAFSDPKITDTIEFYLKFKLNGQNITLKESYSRREDTVGRLIRDLERMNYEGEYCDTSHLVKKLIVKFMSDFLARQLDINTIFNAITLAKINR